MPTSVRWPVALAPPPLDRLARRLPPALRCLVAGHVRDAARCDPPACDRCGRTVRR